MVQNRLEKLAVQLAQALLDEGKTTFETHVGLTRNGMPVEDEQIYVIVVRGPKSAPVERSVREMTKSIPSLTLNPAGNPCPRCGGTGRV